MYKDDEDIQLEASGRLFGKWIPRIAGKSNEDYISARGPKGRICRQGETRQEE